MAVYIKRICTFCKTEYFRTKSQINKSIKLNCIPYCSRQCRGKHKHVLYTKLVNCTNCGKIISKPNSSITTNNFCSSSCSAIYTNTHKTKGYSRSKLEVYIQKRLNEFYPSLNILYNDKTTINSELDIYIPSLKLAFELNGIFHYEPIYGKEKLQNIQNNDNRKFQACLERQIELCIIDTSEQKKFKEKTSKIYLDIIIKIINLRINDTTIPT